MAVDHYRTLHVRQDATPGEIRAAYLELVVKHHPDRNLADPRAVDRFKRIQSAYEVLSNSAKRDAHNRELRARQETSFLPSPSVHGAHLTSAPMGSAFRYRQSARNDYSFARWMLVALTTASVAILTTGFILALLSRGPVQRTLRWVASGRLTTPEADESAEFSIIQGGVDTRPSGEELFVHIAKTSPDSLSSASGQQPGWYDPNVGSLQLSPNGSQLIIDQFGEAPLPGGGVPLVSGWERAVAMSRWVPQDGIASPELPQALPSEEAPVRRGRSPDTTRERSTAVTQNERSGTAAIDRYLEERSRETVTAARANSLTAMGILPSFPSNSLSLASAPTPLSAAPVPPTHLPASPVIAAPVPLTPLPSPATRLATPGRSPSDATSPRGIDLRSTAGSFGPLRGGAGTASTTYKPTFKIGRFATGPLPSSGPPSSAMPASPGTGQFDAAAMRFSRAYQPTYERPSIGERTGLGQWDQGSTTVQPSGGSNLGIRAGVPASRFDTMRRLGRNPQPQIETRWWDEDEP